MAIDIRELKKHGVSSGENKQRFTAKVKDPLVQKCIDTLRDRVKDVRTSNIADYHTYWAIDIAHQTPFAQTTATMVRAILSKNLTATQLQAQMASYGLSQSDLFLSVEAKNEAGAVIGTKLVINPQVFFEIFLPIVIAYHTARTASIFGERDTAPLLKFTPLKQTDRNRVLCDIWTDIVDTISTWYGYPAYLKQAIAQMLKYGIMLAFPLEEWHCEKQIINGEEVVVKEGLRYTMPHPTRMGWDLYHPLPSINTDTGCEWALHWSVLRYGAIMDNRMYWNRKSITHSSSNWFDPAVSQNFFQEVYPCQLRFPSVDTGGASREQKAAFYGTTNRDNAVFLTTVFWKLIPKDWGLGDYKYPVWHRFDLANDDTVIWAAPCAYNPVWFMGYDFDSQAGRHSSLSLETIPHQDQLGNFLSQMHLTAKQNLINIIYYDKNLVDKNRIKEIENLGEAKYRGVQFIDFDSMSLNRVNAPTPERAFQQIKFEQKSIQDLQQLINTHLTFMERVLGFTAQETGGAAQHYQSAKEVGITANSSNSRRNFTASGVDDGTDAWKKQISDGAKAYLNNSIEAQVSAEIPDYEKHVVALGFEVKEKGDRKILIAGKKSSLPLETFSRSNIGPQQPNDPQTAQVIMQSLAVAMQNEQVFAAIGVQKICKLMEQAVRLGGGPRDFDITENPNTNGLQPQLMQQLAPLLQQLQASILKTVTEQIAAPIAEKTAEQMQRLDALEQLGKQLQQTWQANGIEGVKLQLEQAKVTQELAIKRQEFEAEQARKQQEHELQMQIAGSKAGLDMTRVQQTTAQDLKLKEQKAAVDASATLEVSEARAEALRIEANKKPAPAAPAAKK